MLMLSDLRKVPSAASSTTFINYINQNCCCSSSPSLESIVYFDKSTKIRVFYFRKKEHHDQNALSSRTTNFAQAVMSKTVKKIAKDRENKIFLIRMTLSLSSLVLVLFLLIIQDYSNIEIHIKRINQRNTKLLTNKSNGNRVIIFEPTATLTCTTDNTNTTGKQLLLLDVRHQQRRLLHLHNSQEQKTFRRKLVMVNQSSLLLLKS